MRLIENKEHELLLSPIHMGCIGISLFQQMQMS